MTGSYETIDACRSCSARELTPIYDFGNQPIADGLVRPDKSEPDDAYPLSLARCDSCNLVQLMETVAPTILFGADYPYYSSVSPKLLAHFRSSARQVMTQRELGRDNLVVELASNDGYLLKNYLEAGIPVLGIDPAPGPVSAARSAGVDTIQSFFGRELAHELADRGVAADVVHANNVLAHVADLRGFVDGIRLVLKPDGVAIIECPYLLNLLEACEFDTIYHQHLCYFSVAALIRLFELSSLYVNDVERTEIHGGSLRVTVSRNRGQSPRVEELLTVEQQAGLDSAAPYDAFAAGVTRVATKLKSMIVEAKAASKTIAGHGAAAKATTLLGVCGLDASHIDYIVDRNPHKHGWRMPGSRIPIEPLEYVDNDPPDYLLILAWNFADEIMTDQARFHCRGGRFILPIPEPKVLT